MLKEGQENAINGTQKDSVQEETIAVSARKSSRGWESTLAGQSERRAETVSRVSARSHCVIFGIHPDVRVTRNHRDADLVINVLSCTIRLKVKPAKSREIVARTVLLQY